MDRANSNSRKVVRANDDYNEIRHSVVSWRKKSSYKKPIKRRISKLARAGSKKIVALANRSLE